MSVDILTVTNWAAKDSCQEISLPSWQQIETAISALNCENLNDVYLRPIEANLETYLCIGGGAGKYIVTGAIENQQFPTLVDRARSEAPKIQLVVGGQPGEFPANWVVDLSAALVAAKAFYEHGGFECGINWVAV